MAVDEGSLEVIDIEVRLENWPLVLLYGTCTYLPVVALVVFAIHTISYVCDSMRKR